MRKIDELGVFWVEDHEDDELQGRLLFDPEEDGITLSLIGTFNSVPPNENGELIRILGWIGKDKVTLERCFSGGTFHRSPGVPESNYRANALLLGHHVSEPSPEFQSASVSLSNLDNWIGRNAITQESTSSDEDEKTRYDFTYRLKSLDGEVCRFSRGEIALRFAWNTNSDEFHSVTLKQWPVLKITYDERRTLDEIQKDIGLLESFLTLCAGAPTSIDRLLLRRPDIRVTMLSGEEGPAEQEIEFFAQPLRYSDPLDRKPIQRHRMLLTYDEIGGISTVANWLDIAPRFHSALNSLMSVWRAKQMFAENRFLNVTFAAEAFHRITQGGSYMDDGEFKALLQSYIDSTPEEHHPWLLGRISYGNDLPLVKRLRQLAGRSAPATRGLIKNKGQWAGLLSRVRNELTHMGEVARSFGGAELAFLTESVISVVRVCMLLECGVESEILRAKADSYAIIWYKPRLERALEVVRRDFS
ncbi:ApeA N-terminal domain 1-containing protein [Streptomyces prunicolor]|uniref:ApeA N-terminal domain 1-containing protein n=1 Tax=Streptomyces prunicolor TaxID=67348 RepID=UPI001319EBF5|nr:HEPN domain-containing protein [Streptomyces prunicolor]